MALSVPNHNVDAKRPTCRATQTKVVCKTVLLIGVGETGEASGFEARDREASPFRKPRPSLTESSTTMSSPKLPRVAITYCTQCRWMLRAAYFGQELLSTFGTAIGEMALIPASGGIFTVYLTHVPPGSEENAQPEEILLWDRKAEEGFPDTKILKQRLRNHIEPGRDLGHSDKPHKTQTADTPAKPDEPAQTSAPAAQEGTKDCEDCK